MPWWFWLTMFVVSSSIGFLIRSIEPEWSNIGPRAVRIGIAVGASCLVMMVASIWLETAAVEQEAQLNVQAIRAENRARETINKKVAAMPTAEEIRQAQREANYATIRERVASSTLADLDLGREQYLRHCQRCHDVDGVGIATLDVPALHGLGDRDARTLQIYLSERHNVAGLSRRQLDALVNYLTAAFAQAPAL
ncbi:MAG: hypothetical protein AAFV53_19580 [Myxococcota bacterium]